MSDDEIGWVDQPTLYVALPEWVLLAPISSGAKVLYCALVAHLNAERGDRTAYPSQATLAKIVGKAQSAVSRAMAELIEAGIVKRERRTVATNAYRYLVRYSAPEGWAGRMGIREVHAEVRAARAERVAADVGRPFDGVPQKPAELAPKAPEPAAPVRVPQQPTRPPAATVPGEAGIVVDALRRDGLTLDVAGWRSLVNAINAALTRGWHRDDLYRTLSATTDGAKSVIRVLVHRLSTVHADEVVVATVVSERPEQCRTHPGSPANGCGGCRADRLAKD